MKYLFLPIALLIFFFSCKRDIVPQKSQQEKVDDRDVLRPPEGYNTNYTRPADYISTHWKELLTLSCTPPGNMDTLSTTATSITITWSGSSNKYFIYRSNTCGNIGFYVGQTPGTSFTITGLIPNTTYYFVVAATQGNQPCAYSKCLQATTQNGTGSGYENVVFLQFDSCVVSGTQWNVNGPIQSGGSGLVMADRITIMDTIMAHYINHQKIQFTLDSNVYKAADPTHRQMEVFAQNYAWYGSGAGGVAIIGSFNNNTPCWIFTSLLGYNVRNIADAGSHEMGHTVTLHHSIDTCGQTYSPSATLCNDGIYRTKIMGVSYSNYYHIFQTPTRCAGFGIPCLQVSTCIHPDEDAMIESVLF